MACGCIVIHHCIVTEIEGEVGWAIVLQYTKVYCDCGCKAGKGSVLQYTGCIVTER